jgi:hypothetical protein
MLRTSAVFLAVALFCIFFNWIYGRYSHGVHSDSMTLMFGYPLFGGAVVYLLINFRPKAWTPGRFAINIYNSGIATLTVGSALKGVFDIAWTSSPYQPVFMIAGISLASIGMLCYWIAGLKARAWKGHL